MKASDVSKLWENETEFSYCYVIGEIGINHNGDLEIAKKLIQMAKSAGCDAVKFQKRNPDEAVPKHLKDLPRETPWGTLSYLNYKKKIEFEKSEYDEIDKFCSEIQIEWSASAWDVTSLDFLKQYKLPFNKVASAMITNLNFLNQVAMQKKLTFISTGMCELSDIDHAVEIFRKENCPIVILHTVSTYPASYEDLNLLTIKTLQSRYSGIPIGYSGHEPSVTPSLLAAALGAVVIERHVTLDRSMYGTDQSASLEYRGLSKMISEIRRIPMTMGNGKKEFTKKEKIVAEKLRPNFLGQ
jgi:N-acetylneuraminate synthase